MSKKLKLSQWHDGSVLPVNEGVYEVEDSYITWYRKFSDGVWWVGASTPISATKSILMAYTLSRPRWRGIVK